MFAVRRLADGCWEIIGPDDDPRRPSWQRFAVLRYAGAVSRDGWTLPVRTQATRAQPIRKAGLNRDTSPDLLTRVMREAKGTVPPPASPGRAGTASPC